MRCLGYNEKKYKHIDQYFNLKGTKELINEIGVSLNLGRPEIYIELTENTINEFKGTYIHRLLINHFSSWYSPKYSYKIQLILDDLFITKIDGLTQYSKDLKINNEEKNKVIYDKSVRVDIEDKKLLIIKNDRNNLYKVSSNSKDKSRSRLKGKIINTFNFSSPLHIKQVIGKHFKKIEFKEEELPQLIEFIEELKPKTTN
jgi:hypothetical protein